MIGDQTEQGRHHADAHIGAGHLDTDDGLGVFLAKVCRGGMDDTGVHRRAAQTDEEQARHADPGPQRQQHDHDTQGDDALAQPDHVGIVELVGQKTAEEPAQGDADEKQAAQGRRRLLVHAVMHNQVGTAPEDGRLLQRAVAEECQHHFPGTGNGENLLQRQRLGPHAVGCGFIHTLLPQGKAHKYHCRQQHLDDGNDPVACVPAHSGGQSRTQNVGTQTGTQAPHAVQPAHMAAGVVQRHIVVQTGIHAAGTQTVGNGPDTQLPECRADRKPEQGNRRHADAHSRHQAGAEAFGQPVGQKAGHHGTDGNDQRHATGIGQRRTQLHTHNGPGGAQQCIRKAQGNKGYVNDCQKKMYHLEFLLLFWYDYIIHFSNVNQQNKQILRCMAWLFPSRAKLSPTYLKAGRKVSSGLPWMALWAPATLRQKILPNRR